VKELWNVEDLIVPADEDGSCWVDCRLVNHGSGKTYPATVHELVARHRPVKRIRRRLAVLLDAGEVEKYRAAKTVMLEG